MLAVCAAAWLSGKKNSCCFGVSQDKNIPETMVFLPNSRRLLIFGETPRRGVSIRLISGQSTLQLRRIHSQKQESQKANVKRQMSKVEEAEECLQRALVIARSQRAKSWELRAAISLARLWQQQGKRAEAFQLLSEIHDWFTEGFDTVDLQAAKVLVEELNGR